jgi:CRP-like cAMP-binding protein
MGHVPLFNDLPDSIVTKMCLSLKPFAATPGDEIFTENEEGSELYIISRGEVKITRGNMTIALMTSGSFFGEEAVVEFYMKGRRPDLVSMRSESAVAKTDVSLVFLTREDAGDFMARYKAFKNNMLQSYTRRKSRAMERLKRLENLRAEAHAGVVIAGRLSHDRQNAARHRRSSLHSQVVNHLAGEMTADAEAKLSGEPNPTTGSMPGQPAASTTNIASADATAASPQVMEAVSHLNARQERLEQTLDGLLALMNSMNRRLLDMDDELAKQTETMDAAPVATADAPPPPGMIVSSSERPQP